ncbi:hypothetical protein [Promicromonospora sp. NPDC050880]|uniref:hypothetical protein n=1 Tax=Promicromonospora sp. NPDC050880 TaxID=3364406 RepID=UPI0037BD161F
MNVIAALRSLLTAPRRGVTSALLIAVVIAGVVSMHSMSGSPSAHVPPPEAVAAHDVEQAGLSRAMMTAQAMSAPAGRTSAKHAVPVVHDVGGGADCASDCGSHDAHDMTTAMCLMMLVAMLTIAAPPASYLDAVLLPIARRVPVAVPHSRPAAPPSLHALGILRT